MSSVSIPASASTWWRRSAVPAAVRGPGSASTRSSPRRRPYRTFHCGEGVFRPASISATASSSARRGALPAPSASAGSSSSRTNGSPAHASTRRAAATVGSAASSELVGCGIASCICAARFGAARPSRDACSALKFPWRAAQGEAYPALPVRQRGLLTQAAEDGERVGGLDFVDELTAGLDLAVQARGQGVGVLAARCTDDEVLGASLGLVALGLEPFRELAGLLPRPALDPHFPGCESALEL